MSYSIPVIGGSSTINTIGPTFPAPTVTPTGSGSSTWGYTVVARHYTVDIATSAEGLTTSGAAVLSGSPPVYNTVTWSAVPGATAYDVFVSTSPVAVGYLATVTGLTYTDSGTAILPNHNILMFNEAGYTGVPTGMHIGNMSWADLWQASSSFNPAVMMDGTVNVLVEKSSQPPNHGELPYADYGFCAGQFVSYANGTSWSPTGLNVLGVSNTNNQYNNGINGAFIQGANAATSNTDISPWCQGVAGGGINSSPGLTKFLIGVYGTAQNYATFGAGGGIYIMSDFYGEVFLGPGSSQIGVFAAFYGGATANGVRSAGKAAKTAVFYSEDVSPGAGPNDWCFYSAGGQNWFGGPTTVNALITSKINGPLSGAYSSNITMEGTYGGSASIGVAQSAGTPDLILLPTTTGTPGQVLAIQSLLSPGNAQQTYWATIGSSFSALTAGTNTAALVVGTGGSLSVGGSGTITATGLTGTPNISVGTVTASGLIAGNANITLGVAGTTSGVITLEGSTSGAATITAPAVAGTRTNPLVFSNAIQSPAWISSTPTLPATGGQIQLAGADTIQWFGNNGSTQPLSIGRSPQNAGDYVFLGGNPPGIVLVGASYPTAWGFVAPTGSEAAISYTNDHLSYHNTVLFNTTSTQVVGYFAANGVTPSAPTTGYGTPTGNALTASFAAGSITLAELAAEVAQLVLDLKAAGLISA